ncbi:general secretion pathway protein [Acinetobacter sp. ANC 4558]|uniref:type II secretion system protein N n=1 Tax=Acinetobacter sp. ANC 4558 TaxID=1977876 RepID=UPI000A334DAF|nr:type II secretion system protein N [Acinetobacter sp. ANC 4558]OTG81204.1 general secretion pathway protein [Acinetobacter sp. ANC 4558]
MIKQAKNISWWVFAVITFLVFVVLQIPAAWLVSKFYKDNQDLQNIDGNIWNGQADWQKNQLRGTITWSYRPLDLLFFKISANTEVRSGETQLKGVLGYSFGNFSINSLNGRIAPETLRSFQAWDWPSTDIQVKDLNFKYNKSTGFEKGEGTFQWGGGELLYTYSQRQERMSVPSLKGSFIVDKGKLILDVRDQRDQKMANFALDTALMLDAQLTQRMLMNVQSYEGKAAMDTYVISIRQPLVKGGE